MSERLLTPRQAAERLAVSKSTLYHWAYQRRIQRVDLFGNCRFRESDIERIIRDGIKPALKAMVKAA